MRGLIRLAAAALIGISLTVAAACVAAQSSAPLSTDAGPAPTAACRAGHRDDFTGAKLDRARWTTVLRETPHLRVVDGNLVIPTTNTDIAFTAGHPAYAETPTPNIVLQALPQGPFTATAKLAVQARARYQQAGLVIYGDDDNYAKLVLYAAMEDAGERHVAFFREDEGELRGSQSEPLGAAFPDSVWVRLTSDGQTLRAAYSADGTRFTNLPGGGMPLHLAGGATPKIGLLALAGATQAPVIDAKFDWFELCPAAAGR